MVSGDELAAAARWHFEDAYRGVARRDKCSRADFRSGWDAAWQVIGQWLPTTQEREGRYLGDRIGGSCPVKCGDWGAWLPVGGAGVARRPRAGPARAGGRARPARA